MGRAKKTRKFAAVKRMLNPNDIRLKENQLKQKKKEEAEKEKLVRRVPQVASSLFFAHNTALVPPYRVLIDTNFINFSLQNKLELIGGMMDCLYAKCIPCVTDCVMAELEKLGHKYRVALRVARDPRFERLHCSHTGTCSSLTGRNEDVPPFEYPYFWSAESDLPLPDFLSKYKPSMVQNDGKKPWIWVKGSEPTRKDEGVQEAVEEASKLLNEVTDRVEEIKNDASIPVRSSKKTGAKSKKEVREQVQAEATEKLKEIAIKHGYVSGKWLAFAPADKVDMIWSNLATSLVSGPLATTPAHLAKVATSPEQENPSYQHVICVYIPDVHNKDAVTKVMKVLLRNHGLTLSGVKSNLYTSLGIDSKHPSCIPSTTWKNSAVLSDNEMKELKDAFFADLGSEKAAQPEKPVDTVGDGAAPTTGKRKPKLRKKAADDPFASDEDKPDEEEEKRRQELKTKTAKVKLQPKKVLDDTFASDEDDADEEAKRKEEVKTKKAKVGSSARKRHISNDEDEDEDEDKLTKRKTAKSGK
ncbi:putative protein with domain of unknown function (DUF1917) [Lyophyllum shimeji]|uniref:PIN domain-containing protein n=1 Tax=Lyophyllum shimeji TaxID=47721 RepID=A0A9P3UK70_LYOSH|nr:putative protein with domain of unknown function (DUF1917) [Lyophyllum shimeji]